MSQDSAVFSRAMHHIPPHPSLGGCSPFLSVCTLHVVLLAPQPASGAIIPPAWLSHPWHTFGQLYAAPSRWGSGRRRAGATLNTSSFIAAIHVPEVLARLRCCTSTSLGTSTCRSWSQGGSGCELPRHQDERGTCPPQNTATIHSNLYVPSASWGSCLPQENRHDHKQTHTWLGCGRTLHLSARVLGTSAVRFSCLGCATLCKGPFTGSTNVPQSAQAHTCMNDPHHSIFFFLGVVGAGWSEAHCHCGQTR